MEILEKNYNSKLILIQYSDNFYTIDFSNSSIGYTLFTDSTLNGIQNKWNDLQNIINELIELDMDCTKEEIKNELERIHSKLKFDFDTLYNIRKEFL